MSNGEKMYYAMKRHIKRALIRDFDPDWDVLCEEAYKGFIRDMKDDLNSDLQIRYYDRDGDTPVPESEQELEFCYFVEDTNIEVIQKRDLLSNLLIEVYKDEGVDMLPALGRSLDRFYEHVKNTSENNS